MKLSICMMVKNEEKWLEKCLESMQLLRSNVESELIIVDTGSTDRSIEIARRFTDQVYFHEWNNNFSEMRNITLGYARGEWVFIIDGDEVLVQGEVIAQFLNSQEEAKYDSAALHVKNFTDENDGNIFSILAAPRLFRKFKDFRFEGAIHNVPVFEGVSRLIPAVLLHYGYLSTDKDLMDRKFHRTGGILKSELEKDPENIYYLYQLSVTYGMHGEVEEAIRPIEEAYRLCKEKGKNLKEHLYVYPQLALVYLKTGRYVEAESICREGVAVFSDAVDLYFYLAKAQVKQGKEADARDAYLQYLDRVERYNELEKSTMLIEYSLGQADAIRYSLAEKLKFDHEDEQALNLLEKIRDSKYIKESIQRVIDLCLSLKKYDRLKIYYRTIVLPLEMASFFHAALVLQLEGRSLEEQKQCANILSKFDDVYAMYWSYKRSILGNRKLSKQAMEKLKKLDWNRLPDYFGEIVLYFIEKDMQYITTVFARPIEDALYRYFNYLERLDIKRLISGLISFLQKATSGTTISSLMLQRMFSFYALTRIDKEDTNYTLILSRFFASGQLELQMIYQPRSLVEGIVTVSSCKAHAFFSWLYLAAQIEESNKKMSSLYIENALQIFPELNEHLRKWKELANGFSN